MCFSRGFERPSLSKAENNLGHNFWNKKMRCRFLQDKSAEALEKHWDARYLANLVAKSLQTF